MTEYAPHTNVFGTVETPRCQARFPPGFDIRGWTQEEWPDELCKLPIVIPEDLGYRVIPAIRVMCDDPNAPADLKNYLTSLERQVLGCVGLYETYGRQIEKPTKQRAATLERIRAAESLLASVLMKLST
jgi:hypothetical protein